MDGEDDERNDEERRERNEGGDEEEVATALGPTPHSQITYTLI